MGLLQEGNYFVIPEQHPSSEAVESLLERPVASTELPMPVLKCLKFESFEEAKYIITDEITGSGGMGNVYKAYDRLGRAVAIKMVRMDKMDAIPELEEMLEVEAKIHARIDAHPNIIKIHDIAKVKCPGNDNENIALVMEWMEPKTYRTLSELISLGFTDDPDVIVRVAHGLGSAIDYMETQRVIYRDIKPSNIFVNIEEIYSSSFNEQLIEQGLVEDDTVKIMDFGISSDVLTVREIIRLVNGKEDDRTIFGTPDYMSPEAAYNSPSTLEDVRSEIYSSGVVLYEMASGRRPFNDKSPLNILLKTISTPYPDLDESDPERGKLFMALNPVLRKAMEKNKQDRFQSGRELAKAVHMTLNPLMHKRSFG